MYTALFIFYVYVYIYVYVFRNVFLNIYTLCIVHAAYLALSCLLPFRQSLDMKTIRTTGTTKESMLTPDKDHYKNVHPPSQVGRIVMVAAR